MAKQSAMAKRRQRKLKRKPHKGIKLRNDAALAAIFQPGIKTHPDKKKRRSKTMCRKRVKAE